MQRNSRRFSAQMKSPRSLVRRRDSAMPAKRFSTLELLENRTLMSVVTNTNDSGAGSLRDAIVTANLSSGPDTITFNISGTGVQTIFLDSALDSLDGNITIDGTSQHGYAGTPLILIDGSAAANANSTLAVGLDLNGSNDIVRGIAIEGFSDSQIHLGGAGGHMLTGDVIGIGTDLNAPGLGQGNGIVIDSSNNTVGGNANSLRNVISGNGNDGILINAAGNQILGSYIGTDESGLIASGNNNHGIEINGVGNITVSGNVISANNGDGIAVNNVSATGVLIIGNLIGLDSAGFNALPNEVHGIGLTDSDNVIIGGTTASARNVISGNFAGGINLTGSSFNLIQGNYIGTDVTGMSAIGNNGSGIQVSSDGAIDSTHNGIGGSSSARNVISGNNGDGIDIDTITHTNSIQSNYIGTDQTGSSALGNSGNGIYITAGGAVIGGTLATGNVISGNGGDGILLASSSTVQGNLIGIGVDGSAVPNGIDHPDSGAGIVIDGANNTIGGIAADQGNTIANNNKQGIVVLPGVTNTGNRIRGNSIYENAGIGIDLNDDGVTQNGVSGTSGPNHFQVFPVIDTALSQGNVLTLTGHLTAAVGTYNIDFYVSDTADGTGYGEGKVYIGSASVTNGSFTATFTTTANTGVVSATATNVNGDTSEFSHAQAIVPNIVAGPAATTTTLSSSLNPSTYKQSITFTATVTSATTVGGTVNFMDGTTVLATVVLDSSGQATFTTTNLSVGGHSITAQYQGTADFVASASSPLNQQVNKAASATALNVSPSPSIIGQDVLLTANVSDSIGETASGLVTFLDGSTVLGTATLDGSGHATFNASGLSLGGHTFTAVYAGNGNLNGSSDSATHGVNQASTTTALSTSINSPVFGQNVTFTAVVSTTAVGAGTISGSVLFMDGSTVLGSVALSGGSASFSTSDLSVGSHLITATYSGSANYTTSSDQLTQSVAKAATSTTVNSSGAVVVGQPVTFTANVSVSLPGAGSLSGLVTFYDGATAIGTGTLSSGMATFTISSLAVGSHSISASYGGDSSFNGSTSAAISLQVNQASTTTSIASSGNPSVTGQSVTFTATVSTANSGAGAISGSVLFMDGSTVLGSAVLSGGSASFTTSALSTGGHSVVAVYSGNTNYSGSSNTVVQNVNKGATATTLTSNVNPSTFGQSITLSANVAINSPASGTLSGTVTFMDGSTVLATVNLSGSNASITLNSLGAGSHSITATYSGDANFTGSSNALVQNVNKGATATTLTSNVNPSTFGQSVTLTANIAINAPAAGTLSGTVTFMDGSTLLGAVNVSGSSASLTLSSLAAGNHSITATYNGDTNFTGSNATLTQNVNQATTGTTVNSSANPSNSGQAVTFTATVTSGAGVPTGSVTFKDGSTVLGTATLSGGTATFTTSALTVGGHSITAVYSGAANYAASTSAPLTQTVNSVPASLSGYVYKDANNDGIKQSGETGIAGVSVTLSGTNDLGTITPIVVVTNSGGMYVFANLRPGTYTITEQSHTTAPLNAYVNGLDALGNLGGTITAQGAFSGIAVGSGAVGINYTFGELQNVLSGTTYRDITGNGRTADDVVYGGVTVKVYRDLNNNGIVDTSDGSPVSTVVSDAATGAYSVLNLAAGDYLVRETVPTGFTRTQPVLSDAYDIAITGNSSNTGLDFDNYKACTGTISNVSFSTGTGCNKVTFTDLRSHTQQGQIVTVTFTLSGATSTLVTLVSYDAPTPSFDANIADQQSIFDIDSQVFTPGQHTLTVTIPNNYYQIDFVRCAAIDKLGPAGSNIFYSAQGRLISADNAGTHSDVDDMAACTGFWANLGQTVLKNFNVTDDNPNPTALSSWLVSNYPNLYGTGAYNLTGKNNAFVATVFKNFYCDQAHHKTDASVMATALNVYASTQSLGGDAASDFGFDVTSAGLGAASFNVGANGAAFGVANNATLTVSQLLFQANYRSSNDVLYSGASTMLTKAYSMFELINSSGGI